MKNFTENISTLICKEISGTITESELLELNSWINNDDNNRLLYEKLTSEAWFSEKVSAHSDLNIAKRKSDMQAMIRKISLRRRIIRTTATASAAALVIGFVFLFNIENDTPQSQINQEITYKALLTFDDGTEIKLSDTLKQFVTEDIKIANNNISYSKSGSVKPSYNKLYVPRAGEYSVTLSDSTRVWLNSDTQLKYPTIFSDSTRQVYLDGEAYFEVTKSSKPFIVITPNSSIRVLGTSFNVSCYDGEPEYTTLVNGCVELQQSRNNKSVILNPGMQGIITKDGADIKVLNVDTNIYTAWHYNILFFDNETLESIMRRMERWYNIEVEYKNEKLKDLHFYFKMAKTNSLDEFIEILESTKIVKCKIDNSKIIIMGV